MKLVWKPLNNFSISNNRNSNFLLMNYLVYQDRNYIVTQDNTYIKYEI
jgi:hypothetical protein